MVKVVVPLVVKKVLVDGAVAAPPPRIGELAVNAAEVAQVDAEEKYGIPPLVPATVSAGVVVGVATEINPPVNDTLVTVPEPELAATHNVPVPVELRTCPEVPTDAVPSAKVPDILSLTTDIVPVIAGEPARTTAPVPVVPFDRSEAAGCVAVNSPVVAE
jgi:hypothetical protein